MTKLADLVESLEPTAFDMGFYWGNVPSNICGTAGCLAGWQAHSGRSAEQVATLEGMGVEPNYFNYAMMDLGLHKFEAHELFVDPYWWGEAFYALGLRDEEWYRANIHGREGAMNLSSSFTIAQVTSKEAVIVLRAIVDGTISL
jgi:hypothetical protein